tara:strand:- start:5325 stop:5543 length:219 start_codon:yes stop_codon:yes gene_type:complete
MIMYAVPSPGDILWQDLNEEAQNHEVRVDHDEEVVIGSADELANFFRALDGPGQSFPIVEFLEWIEDYKLVQ